MSEKLLSRQGIAEKLATSPSVAATILSEWGVKPIDFGRGRHRGMRWSASAVDEAIKSMHAKAQAPSSTANQSPRRTKYSNTDVLSLADMSYAEIFALTQAYHVQ